MKKVILMCGSHMRHMGVANELYQEGRLQALVIEEREEFIPTPPDALKGHDRENYIMHFQKRNNAEKKYFGDINVDEITKNVPTLHVTKEELNDSKVKKFLEENGGDMLISYGVHKLTDEIINVFPNMSFNIHGGLSPWYRGCITLFWPFYFLKPNQAGMTIHRLTQKLDGGEILHHSVPKLEKGDTLHEVSCKAVVQVGKDLCQILEVLDAGEKICCIPQKNAGKLFVSDDWNPQTLRVIYDFFEDKIVDMYLDGELERQELPLVDFFENIKKR